MGGGKGPGCRVFVNNLPFNVDWAYLKDLFRDFGIHVRHADVILDQQGRPKGSATVEVDDLAAVRHASEVLDGLTVEGRRIAVREDRMDRKGESGKDGGKGKAWHALPDEDRPPRPLRAGKRVLIENLPSGKGFGWQQVKDFCRDAGLLVKHANIVDRDRGTAIVELDDDEEIRTAVAQLHDVDVDGHRLLVREALPEDLEMAGKGKGGSRGHDNKDRDAIHDQYDRFEGRGKDHGKGYGRGYDRDHGKGYDRDHGKGWGKDRFKDHDRDHVKGRGKDYGKDRDRGKGYGKDYGKDYDRDRGTDYREEQPNPRRGKGHKGIADDREPAEMRGSKRPDPDSEEVRGRRLFAENLGLGVDWRQLKELFNGYFEVAFTDVIKIDEDIYGIIEFLSHDDALEACMQFNGVLLEERPLRLRQDRGEFTELRATKRARTTEGGDGHPKGGGRDRRDDHIRDATRHGKGGKDGGKGPRVYVGNLDYNIEWQELKDFMRQAGNVRFCDIKKTPDGKPKGCALVQFDSQEEVDRAIDELHDAVLGSRPILVRAADDRP